MSSLFRFTSQLGLYATFVHDQLKDPPGKSPSRAFLTPVPPSPALVLVPKPANS